LKLAIVISFLVSSDWEIFG